MQEKKGSELIIQDIIRQYFSNVPIRDFKLDKSKLLSYEEQGQLINGTVNSSLNLKYPVNIEYQKAFLKYLLKKLELQESVEFEIHDSFYTAYTRLVALGGKKEEYSFKHYILKDFQNTTISLKENINIISQGTTGLRTWSAALALSEWALQNQQIVKNKKILELGSGIGLTGLTLALLCKTKTVYFTDCHPTVIENLVFNIKLNIDSIISHDCSNSLLEEQLIAETPISINDCDLSCLNLPWEEVNEDICRKKIGQLDTIFAADVVFDSTLFTPLINAIKCLSETCQAQEIIFSCTERNPDTLSEFLQLIGTSFTIEELEVPLQQNFIWSTESPVRLFKFQPVINPLK